MWADPAVARHISGVPSTREESWARLLRYAGLWPLLGFGYWLVEERATGRLRGRGRLRRLSARHRAQPRRRAGGGLGAAPRRAWPRLCHRGAPGGACTGPTRHLGPRRSVCMIAPENAPSLRVAQKCGYRRVRADDLQGRADPAARARLIRPWARSPSMPVQHRLAGRLQPAASLRQRLPPVRAAAPGIVPGVAQQVGLAGSRPAPGSGCAAWAASLAALSRPAPARRVATISLCTA